MAVGQPENAGVGPYELQEPVWAKMSGLAPGGGNNKKRKKSETKPQAQINKCNNEKRRREQENNYIEELAELISANFADMSSLSVKPDKCAILQATVNRIREQRDGGGDPVQQGEVSSSRPAILPNEIYGPLLLEALDGFVFVISPEGRVEHVTDNVAIYIKFVREELLGHSIFNFLHHGDHGRFGNLLPKEENGWAVVGRQRPFSARFLIKANENQYTTLEEKQQRIDTYELMQVSSTPLRDHVFTLSENTGGDGTTTSTPPPGTPCILCMASRITHRDRNLTNVQNFTTKLDTSGRIIGVDTSTISATYSPYINKDLMNQFLKDIVPQQDLHKWNAHFRETLTAGQAHSALYRFQLGNDKFVPVQTKSKLFKSSPHSPIDSIDFVMATHTIVPEDELLNPTDPGGGNPVNNNNITITNNNNSSSSSSSSPGVGGPLMTSVVNGARSGTAVVSSASDATTSSSLLNTTTTSFTTSYNLDSDFNLDIFPSTTWDLENHSWEARSDSRQSLTPVSTPTPRPPSNPSYSPATTVAQSPLASQFFAQPSPNVPNNPATPVSYSSTFSFSPIAEPPPSYPPMEDQQKDTKANVMEESSTMMSDSIRLRHLLTKPPNQVDSSDGDNKNKILKGLLNQQDDDEGMSGDNRTSPRGLMGRGPVAGPSSMELPNKSGNGAAAAGNNNMLRKLLNDTSDEDDSETRGMKKKSNELLQQLLKGEPKEQADGDDAKKGQVQSNADLLRSLGFSSSPAPSEPNNHVSSVEGERVRKRPEEDTSGRRTADGAQVSSSAPSGQSKLWEKNRMLVSLLNKEPGNVNQPIPYIPEDELHAIPQERLPKVNTNRAQLMNAMSQGLSQVTSMAAGRMSTVNMGRPMQTTNYLSSILTSPNNAIQRSESSHQTNHVDNFYNSIATTSNATAVSMESMEKDETLSNLLEEVISTYPDFYSSFPQNERVSKSTAITMIQNSLMQCESGIKSPPSPGNVLSATPPTYISAITTQNNQFPPPPNYNQAAYSINSVNINNNNNNNINTIKQHRLQVRTGAAPYNTTAGGINAQQQIIQQRKQQEQQKRRLLLQQQQQLVIPSNAATSADMNSGLQNFDILLKNTVAPNVSLQRSASVPESQLSPGYNAQPVSGQSPYSPHSQLTSPISQQANYPQTTVNNYQQVAARLSPLGNYNQQLSPRQVFNQPNSSQGSANWQQQQPQARLSLQNPMLNAQLTGSYMSGPNGRHLQRAPPGSQQPTLNSPGNVPSRHSPYASTPESFPTSTSPNSAYNQSSYLRIQRANSAPTATTQLAGGLGSPRPYGGREHHPPHPYSPAHPHPASHHPMMYPQQQQQDSSQYHCSYSDQAQGLQLPYNGQAVDRGRHLQPQGVSGNGPSPTSEYVRQELRAVVGARTGQQQPAQQPQPNRTAGQLLNQQQVADLESLGIHFEMPASGASESPKLWATMGSDMSSMSPQPATSRSTMEESRPGDHKASLLQKLLSE